MNDTPIRLHPGGGDTAKSTPEKCPICGKEFYRTTEWAYRRNDRHGKMRYLCSYSCMTAYLQTARKEIHKVR